MRWCIQSDEESVLFGAERGCAEFEQRLLRFDAPGSDQGPSADDEVLYVLRGRGTATIGGEPARLARGTAVYVAAGSSWRVDEAERRAAHRRRVDAAAARVVRPPPGEARALAREPRARRDAGARRVPSGGLAGRGLLPRRHTRRPVLMPRIERSAQLVWEGNVARGIGSISAGTGAFADLGFSLPTRVGQPEGKTSPEELLAAAHGGCITMSLASELTQAGPPPRRLDGACRLGHAEVEGRGHQSVASYVDAVVDAAGLDDDGLREAFAKADEGCPFSQLLRAAGVELHLTARRA